APLQGPDEGASCSTRASDDRRRHARPLVHVALPDACAGSGPPLRNRLLPTGEQRPQPTASPTSPTSPLRPQFRSADSSTGSNVISRFGIALFRCFSIRCPQELQSVISNETRSFWRR